MTSDLDNPAWSALTTLQAHLAVGDSLARRYPPDIAPIAGIGVRDRRAIEELCALVPDGDVLSLPGTLEEKLDPWMSAIHDAIVALTDQRSSNDASRLIDELIGRNQLSLESVTFLRGRSLHRQIVVVDEAQNLEPTTLKTPDRCPLHGRVEQCAGGADPGLRRATLLRAHHPVIVRAQRRCQPRRRAVVTRTSVSGHHVVA